MLISAKDYKWLVNTRYAAAFEAGDHAIFVHLTSGQTVLLNIGYERILNKAKTGTDIIFEDKELNLKRSVSREEVAQNSYVLSVSNYIAPEKEKEDIDPIALENTAREQFLKRLRKELEFNRAVCRLEGISILPFITKIRDICDEYEKDIRDLK